MYKLAKFIQAVLMKSPLWLCFFLGEALGIIFYLNSKKHRTAFRNLKMAFPQKDTAQIHKIMRKSFRNLGLSIIEILIAPRLAGYMQISGKENIDTKQGGILVGIHEGNYELFNTVFTKEYPLAVLVKEQKNKGLDKFLNEFRQTSGITIYYSLKNLIRHLKSSQIIGIIVDQGAEDNAGFIEFFSQLVPTPGGAVYLSRKFNKNIYPAFDYRGRGFCHNGYVHKPLLPQEKSQEEMLKYLNQLYENELKKHPQEYIWAYKRFKRKRTLDVLLLSDGKTGHLKQTTAFLSFLKEEDYSIREKIITVEYKHSFSRLMAEVCSIVSGRSCIGCGRCLKFILAADTYSQLKGIYADIVVSAGSSIAPINRLFSSYLGASSVVILRPNTPLQKFDLTIIPEHDRIYGKKITKIKGALVYPENLEEKAVQCRQLFKLSGDKKISLFLGGPLNDKTEFLNNLRIFIPNLMHFSGQNGYKLLVSTSRRSPKEAEAIIEENLRSFKNTEAIVYPRENNYDFIFDGFISLSEIVFVSNESISMVSEAISSKKPCVCVAFETQTEKYNIFLQSIKNEVNFLNKPYIIKDSSDLGVSDIFEQNRAVIKTAIKKII